MSEKPMKAEDGGKNEKETGPVGSRVLAEGKVDLAKSERPYAGSLEGRFEDREEQSGDMELLAKQKAIAEKELANGKELYPQHGNVGVAGNYDVGWKVQR